MLFNDLYHPCALTPPPNMAPARAMFLDLAALRTERRAASALMAATGCETAARAAALAEMRLSFQIAMLRKRMKQVRFAPEASATARPQRASAVGGTSREDLHANGDFR